MVAPQASIDFDQVRMMLFPDPILSVSSPTSEQPLGQQVPKQPVLQSQEQLTDNAASSGGDDTVSGIPFATIDFDAHDRAAHLIW